uniref:Annexin n=1 Tax=Monopterus albus TaxID=43700 RepID=A0A3Q3IC39_MONAL
MCWWLRTIKDCPGADPQKDAEVLHKAMKGLGTDEKAIVELLGNRSNKQRAPIVTAYKKTYGKDLIKELKSELNGPLEKLVVAMMMSPANYDAYLVKGTVYYANECTFLKSHTFHPEHGKSLEDAIKNDTSGDFRNLLVTLCQVAVVRSRCVISTLLYFHKVFHSVSHKTYVFKYFNYFACNSCLLYSPQVFQEYMKLSGKDIEKSICSEMHGNLEHGMVALVKCIKNIPAFFAEVLNKAIKGTGTSDRTLIRIMVSRSEIDMLDIRQEYKKNYGKSLYTDIAGDTGGDYEKLLLKLCGGND